ncbi:MAG: transglutaminase family protein [Proteobacteria bacterium]|nr:transglutaminase family protein [Pseudomonadota bacterium]
MTIRVALHHQTRYRFDRPVRLAPHEVRLRPAIHNRTPILSYSLTAKPARHFINWQQDAYGNFVARLTFPEPTCELEVTVDLVADMTVINPFDFFVEPWAEPFPFAYPQELRTELAPFMECDPVGPRQQAWLEAFRADFPTPITTTDLLVRANQAVQHGVSYLIRMEPGVQSCETTLSNASGSCRDSAWLLVQILRNLGLAARFVSGYLIQLTADVKPLEGPAGPGADFTDLHAWCEAYVPGAGWIGLDATSGLFAGEGHIPLAASAQPSSAAPIIGKTDPCESRLDFTMTVQRVFEDPRVTLPYTDAQWQSIRTLGHRIDADLRAGDVRLTQGGEPTFVSALDMQGAQWNTAALGPDKERMADALLRRLSAQFTSGALLHFGQGKWYPGEALPRWAMTAYWRTDGKPVWRDAQWLAGPAAAGAKALDPSVAAQFGKRLCEALGLNDGYLMPAFEDALNAAQAEGRLPENVQELIAASGDADARAKLVAQLARGLNEVVGYVLPLKAEADGHWHSSRWPLRGERLTLLPGDSPLGYRLPLASLPWAPPEDFDAQLPLDPFAPRHALADFHAALGLARAPAPARKNVILRKSRPAEIVHTALCLQGRSGTLHVFLPPIPTLESWLALVAAIEHTTEALELPVCIEGYTPPRDERLQTFSVTPDPGVIEVNIHPSPDWDVLEARTETLYAQARACHLATEKFMLDGRHTGTGGGNHITLGGARAADSPFLRRPDLLKSLIAYWQRHPALSYLFSGAFIGPTSQAPRVDEARDDALYELTIAFQQLDQKAPPGQTSAQPWLVDRLLRNHLVDLTGNTHRAEFCIDKLYSPDGPAGRLGVVELRAFEMPPHARMSLVQALLLRALVARFWRHPDSGQLVRWGTALHDRFMLPHFVELDMRDICRDLRDADYAFEDSWFSPFMEFRFPRCGTVTYESVEIELRQGIEPWHVLGEEMAEGSTARYVDSSVERLQVRVRGMTGSRHAVLCNGRWLPLHPTGVPGEFVAGVRFKAWAPHSALHPGIGAQGPLVFDLVDRWNERAVGGCTYHVSHPGGRSYDTFPVNANEAEARRRARFWEHGHTPGPIVCKAEPLNPDFPLTLDLRFGNR